MIEASAAADGHWSRAFAATAQGWLDQDLDLLTTAHDIDISGCVLFETVFLR